MSYVNLFGTFTLAPTDTTSIINFDGNDGADADPTHRLMPPPLAGVIKRITLRTITLTGANMEGVDYFVEMWGTRVAGGAAPGNADRAAFYMGRTLAPLIPTAANLAARDNADLWQDVDWPYELQNPLGVGHGGVPPNVSGLQARLTVGTAVPADEAVTIGIGILVESRVPGYPPQPFQQAGGTAAGFWPGNV